MYDLTAYGGMLADVGRITAFHQAIRAAVQPGQLVLELGTGPGLMAFWAAQCGARHVHAVEPNAVINLARQGAMDNGLAERITFHTTMSSRLALAERAAVLIEDMRGTLPCHRTHLLDVIDARARLLTPDAVLICQRDTLWVTAVTAEGAFQGAHEPWAGERWGVDLRAARRLVPNNMIRHRCAPEAVLAEPRAWAEIHYPTVSSPHVRGGVELRVTRAGTAHGLLLWFAAELFGGAGFSNAPTEPEHTYGSGLLLWPAPTVLAAGDRVVVKLDAVFTGNDYEWAWDSTLWRDSVREPVAQYKQSTFQGRPLAPQLLAKQAGHFRPRRNATAEAELFLLNRMDGSLSNAELAVALRAAFPEVCATDAAAQARVAEVMRRLARD